MRSKITCPNEIIFGEHEHEAQTDLPRVTKCLKKGKGSRANVADICWTYEECLWFGGPESNSLSL